ncbi:hypothetical protein DL765_006764 [Monosporascus sp. GIB2]|nr:hypothetical protein DL765_006764 [Monosporascus sp. GIB2]
MTNIIKKLLTIAPAAAVAATIVKHAIRDTEAVPISVENHDLSTGTIVAIVTVIAAVFISPFMWPLTKHLLRRRTIKLRPQNDFELGNIGQAVGRERAARDFAYHTRVEPSTCVRRMWVLEVELVQMPMPSRVSTLSMHRIQALPIEHLPRLDGPLVRLEGAGRIAPLNELAAPPVAVDNDVESSVTTLQGDEDDQVDQAAAADAAE